MFFSSNQSFFGKLCSTVRDCRGDSCKVEPVSSLEDVIKIKICLCCCRNRRMCSVINDLGGSHGRTGLQKVNAQSFATFCNMLCAHIIFAKSCNRTFTDLIVRNCCHKFRIMSIICQGYRYVCFSTSVIDIKLISLDKLFIVGSR